MEAALAERDETVPARFGFGEGGSDTSVVEITRARTPDGDFRVGDMFALPCTDASLDVATSFKRSMKGCDATLMRPCRIHAVPRLEPSR